MTDAEKHACRSAEARRRIALAAALDERAASTDGETAVILAGVRAHFWLVAGLGRGASERFIADLCHDFGTATVLAAAIEMCRTQPLGPKAWMQQACTPAPGRAVRD